jgi:hypothetical protein
MELAIMIRGLVSHTSRKKRGRLRKAASLSRRVSGSVPGAVCPLRPEELFPDDFFPDELPKRRSPGFIRQFNKIPADMLQEALKRGKRPPADSQFGYYYVILYESRSMPEMGPAHH